METPIPAYIISLFFLFPFFPLSFVSTPTPTMSTDFVLPQIIDNDDGSWGPSGSHLPTGFKESVLASSLFSSLPSDPKTFNENSIPYAHYNKADRIERIVEWYDAPTGQASTSSARPSSSAYNNSNNRTRRDGASGTTNDAFGYVHGEDEKSFSLVDNKSSAGLKPRNQGGLGINRAGGGAARGVNGRPAVPAGKGVVQPAKGGPQQKSYGRNWNQVSFEDSVLGVSKTKACF